ncbi:hypothetical protein NUU61_001798 [Penicillium alfredii]|uniref:Major facilitator superfamily (MFS) profile domain-containing protein n=1 Tax=Penicillium alfredii TaxID=1506179 RepID=A0A9W9FQ94_9EURO|nr:uncharacterized protein NUU61_001798 [Penicillium alfredii]KAJ5104451.1 hypothetical protein NUU61_001798 [Penicillium alfredii]
MAWTKKIFQLTDRPPWLLPLRSSQLFIVTTISLSMFTDLFLYAMIVPVMPRALITRAGVPFEDREYWNSVLLVSEAVSALVASPIFGYVLDVSGTRQGPYLFGLLLLFASMVILTVAHSVVWYVMARVLQGAATAMVSVAGLAIVTDTVDKRNLGEMLGYIGMAMTLGFVSGPLLGGLVYQVGGFYWVFGMAFAVVALDFFLRLAVVEKKVAERWLPPPDSERHSQVNENGTEQPDYGAITNGNGHHPVKEVAPTTAFALFKLLQKPRILISLWAVIVGALVLSAFDATLPTFVEDTFHWNSFGAGLIFLPGTVACVFQPLFGYLSDRLGARVVAFTGFALLAPCLACLRFVESNTMTDKVILCILLALAGMCNDLSEPAQLVEVQRVLDEMEEENPGGFGEKGAIAQAFSLENMAHFGGLALGPMAGGFVKFHYGWKVMTLSLGVLCAATAVPMLWLSGPIEKDCGTESEDAEREPLLAQ